jgi:hypothetical protein
MFVRRTASIVVFMLTLVFTPACVIVPGEVEDAIKVNAAAGDGDLGSWDSMTPLERKYAFWQSVRFSHRMDESINDTPMPQAFATVPDEFSGLLVRDAMSVAPVGSASR